MLKRLYILLPLIIGSIAFVHETHAFGIFQKIRSYWQYQHPLISECELYIGLPQATIELHPGIQHLYSEKISEQLVRLESKRNSNNYPHLNTLWMLVGQLKQVKNQLINLNSQLGWWENDSKNIYAHAESILRAIKKELKALGV